MVAWAQINVWHIHGLKISPKTEVDNFSVEVRLEDELTNSDGGKLLIRLLLWTLWEDFHVSLSSFAVNKRSNSKYLESKTSEACEITDAQMDKLRKLGEAAGVK